MGVPDVLRAMLGGAAKDGREAAKEDGLQEAVEEGLEEGAEEVTGEDL